MITEQTIKSVEKQIRLMQKHRISAILCPYCHHALKLEDNACCEDFAKTANVVLDRLEVEDAQELADKIAENLYKGKSKLVN